MRLSEERFANAACSSRNRNRRAGDDTAGAEMKMAQCPLLVTHPPGQQFLGVGENERQIGRLAGTVAELVGIACKIEEKRRQAGEMDIFVTLVADDGEAALLRIEAERGFGTELAQIAKIVFPMDLVSPIRRIRAGEERRERVSVELRRDVEA